MGLLTAIYPWLLPVLALIATLTALTVEGLKKILEEKSINYSSNVLAGAVAVVLSAAIGAAYLILTETAFNAKIAVLLIGLMFLSWLASMVGYDKVAQAITQYKESKESEA